MSYGQRAATYEQFVNILKNGTENKLCNTLSADQIADLKDGVVVSLRLEEMSCNYPASDSDAWKRYVRHVRVHATVLSGSYSTYVVDVLDNDWFDLPPFDRWQATLAVIFPVPEPTAAEATEKTAPEEVTESPEEDGEEGGSGVREPLPDDSPAPTTAAKRQTRKRPARTTNANQKVTEAAQRVAKVSEGLNKRLADGDTAAETVPVEASVE